MNKKQNLHRARILATECIRAPAMASTLFGQEAIRAAVYFFLCVCFDVEELFAEACDDACGRVFAVLCEACDAECEATARTDAVDERPWRERTCVTGARRIGCETASKRPGLTLAEERWFQRRSSSTLTLKRSAIVTSVSPERVV